VSRSIGRLIVITDVHIQSRFTHLELAELACAGGADVIQLRDKRLPDAGFIHVATRVRDICDRYQKLLIINDRVHVTREVGADGVHVGRTDMAVEEARALLGDGAIIGTSAGSLAEAKQAEEAGADYVGFGHIFATSSKAKTTPPVGVDALATVCDGVDTPVIAIGGINEGNLPEVMRAGAWGIAVIAAVCASRDPRAATAGLRAAIDQLLQ